MAFSRKKRLEELRTQLESLRSEFHAAEGDRQQQESRLNNVEGIIDGHDATLDNTAEMLRVLDPEALAKVEQLEDLSTSTNEALTRLQDALAAQRITIADHETTISDQRATIEALRNQIRGLENRTTEENARMQARLGEITEQVLHQVEELGMEVDAATRHAEDAARLAEAPLEAMDEIKASQVKLANEQVRYDLALRAELAELAERLRRGNKT